jgi:hypothetical protein
MNYYIIAGYIYTILSIIIITLICIRSMYDNNFNISSYYYINEHSTGIIKNIECDNRSEEHTSELQSPVR